MKSELIVACMDRSVGGWVDVVDGWMDGQTGRWSVGWIDGWMDAQRGVWMDG